MAEEADADLRENRFSYLLQPIRDLASNWDINIAGELEEYLEELENLTFAIEGCGPSLNFAEAALLIQVRSQLDKGQSCSCMHLATTISSWQCRLQQLHHRKLVHQQAKRDYAFRALLLACPQPMQRCVSHMPIIN